MTARRLDWQTGSFTVSCCENGHVALEVVGTDGTVAMVFSLSIAEAVDLARTLRVVVHEAERFMPRGPVFDP